MARPMPVLPLVASMMVFSGGRSDADSWRWRRRAVLSSFLPTRGATRSRVFHFFGQVIIDQVNQGEDEKPAGLGRVMHHFHKPVNQAQDYQTRLGRRNTLLVEALQDFIH